MLCFCQVLEENKGQNDLSGSSKRRTLEDTCNICQGKVFLMERQIEGKKLYHRHCLRNMQKEQSSTLRSAQKSDDQQQRGLDQCCEVQNESMEHDEFHSDVASGERDSRNAVQVPVSRLDPTISSGNEKATVAEVSAGATHDLPVTSNAAMNPSTEVTSVNKSVVVVTSAVGASSISSGSSSATFQPKAGAISSPVAASVSRSPVSHAEERTNMSDKSKPAKPVDSSEGTNQSKLTPTSHDLQTSVSQSLPISSSQPTQILPLTTSPSSLPSKTSKSSESPSTQSIQVPLRPKLPPTIIPQQSGANVNVSPTTSVPPKPPRCSVIVETIPVEPGKGPNSSLAEPSTPSLSQSFSSDKVVSVASNKIQKPDCNIPAGGVGDARSSVQTATTIHPSQSTSARNNVASPVLSPKTRPAPNPPDQAVSTTTNLPVSTLTNLPISTSSNLPISNSTNLPISNSTNLLVSTSVNLPISNSTKLPVSDSTILPISTSTSLPVSASTNLPSSTLTNIPASTSASPSVPVTTLRSILKSHPAPCPPSHSSTTPSHLPLKISSSSTPSSASSLASPSPSVSTSESLPSSTSTPSTTASSASVPKPAVRHHISTPAVHPVSTAVIHPVSTPVVHPVSTAAIHPVSTPAVHPVSTPANVGGNSGQNLIHSSSQKPETTVSHSSTSHSSTSHVTSTQSIKTPISHPGRTPPGRPVLPPSGLPGQIPSTSKPSLAVSTSPVQSSSTSTSATSASAILHPTLTQPSDKPLALPSASPAFPSISAVPPTAKDSSESVTVIPTKETSEQIISEDASQNGGQFAGQVSSQSAVQSGDQSVGQHHVQSGGKHPPIPKRPPSILVSREMEENKHLPVKLENAMDQKLVLNSGYKDNQESKENKEPVTNEALVNGATVEPRPDARRSVRTNPFNSPEPPSSVNPEDFHGKLVQDETTPGISRKETPHKIQELPKKSIGGGDTNKDVEKVLVKPSPSPRSTLKLKADAPIPSPTQSESTWYVDLEPEDLQNERSSAVPESHVITGTKLVPSELGQGMVEEKFDQQKAISLPVPLPRSRSKKGNDDALPVNGEAQTQRKRLSPAPPTVQPSNSDKPSVSPADGTTSSGIMRSPPPRPTPPRAESIQQARKKITPDTTFTFEDQSFNFSPMSGNRKSSDGRELHLRSSTVASKHNQPVVKRKVSWWRL